MELKQAVEVLNQAIQIALGAGAFKNTKDVAIIHQALEVVVKDAQIEVVPTEEVGKTPRK